MFMEALFKYKHLLDFSKHQSKIVDHNNKKVNSKMKDVYKEKPIGELVAIKSKI